MRTLAIAALMATFLTIPATAKTFVKGPQHLLPDYRSASNVKNTSSLHIGQWTEGYPPEQLGERNTLALVGSRSRDRR
jgi:hypothetical protein